MDRKIKGLVINVYPKATIDSTDGEITEYWKETESIETANSTDYTRKLSLWYKQGNYEINGKYVVEIEWEG